MDLFRPTRALFAKAAKPLTINGIHLTPDGDRELARVIDKALFSDEPARDPQALERLRQAILDKNFTWYNRYRTTDGYSIHGGRADLQFVGGQTNRVVMQREMEVLDVMTANRDRRIWAVARGGDLKVDDSNTPPFIPVQTNKPGAGPNGEHLFLDGDEAITQMTVARGMKVNLFASEKQFPELAKPVQMSFDARGRLWVAAWPSYPHWKPKEEMNDKLLIFEDTDGDGRADVCKTFADRLHNPTGFEFVHGGVLVAQAPALVLLKDTDGDDKADVRIRVLEGLDTADTHHTSNSFQTDPGGAIYFQEGTFHHTQVETPYGPPQRNVNAGVFRYEPARRSSRSTSPTASPTRTATSSTAGARTSSPTAPAPIRTTGPSSPATWTIPGSTPGRPRSTSSAPALAPASSGSTAGTSPRRTRATCSSPTSSASRASSSTGSRTTTPASSAARSSRSSSPPTRTSAPRTSRSGPTARSTSSTGRTRSSATCSTTSATRAATAATAASTASRVRAARC